MNKKLLFLISCLLLGIGIQAQSLQNHVLASSGASTVGINSLDWTLGEFVTVEFSNGTKLNQGFHQPLLSAISTSVIEVSPLEEIEVFPNPSLGEINLSANFNMEHTQLKLISIDGKQLSDQSLNGFSHSMNVNDMNDGVYLLQLIKDQQVIVRKIILKKQN